MFEGYKGKIVHFIGGIHEYLGEIQWLDQTGWLRISNPVLARAHTQGKEAGLYLERLGGPGEVYAKWVDLYIPLGQSLMEVRILMEGSSLHNAYMKQVNQPKIENIIIPGAVDQLKVKIARQ